MRTLFILMLSFPLVLASCGGGEPDKADPAKNGKAAAPKSPKDVIAHQLALLQAGKVEELKAGFTDRQKSNITEAAVQAAKAQAAKMTMGELFVSVEMGEDDDGKKTAKVKMKDDRTLTTLIEVGGVWLADTVWFK